MWSRMIRRKRSGPAMRLGVLLAVLAMSAVTARAEGEIVVDESFPVVEQEVRLHVIDDDGDPVAGAVIEVTYRPGSSVEKVDPIGITEEDGGVTWIPSDAGIARVTATWLDDDGESSSLSTAVSVRFAAPPVTGIIIMVAAGLLLVVGSVIRMFNLLRTPEAP
jgi:hypothetical protein